MYKKATDAYVRVPFTVADPSTLTGLSLSMQYRDNFVMYLNGVEVARRNALPRSPGTPSPPS